MGKLRRIERLERLMSAEQRVVVVRCVHPIGSQVPLGPGCCRASELRDESLPAGTVVAYHLSLGFCLHSQQRFEQ